MEELQDIQEKKNKRKGAILSTILHILLLLIFFLPLLSYPDPPPGQEGILVNLGIPDVGSGSENAAPSKAEPVVEEEQIEPVEEVEPEKPVEVEKPEPPKPTPPIKTKSPEVITTNTNDPAIDKVKQEEEARKYQEAIEQMEAEMEKQREEEAKRKAEAEARRKAEAEAKKKADYEKAKGKFSGLFGSGEGKGKTDKSGNQGDPNGDPDADALEGLSTGPGKLGGGLWGRGVVASPNIENNTGESGIVVLRVCVNASGKVVSAKYTQSGSSTTDTSLKKLAIDHAYQWRFTTSEIDNQCGTITFDFKFI